MGKPHPKGIKLDIGVSDTKGKDIEYQILGLVDVPSLPYGDDERVHTDSLDVLANLTQQLYLGMTSYEQWREDKWKKRAERRKDKSN